MWKQCTSDLDWGGGIASRLIANYTRSHAITSNVPPTSIEVAGLLRGWLPIHFNHYDTDMMSTSISLQNFGHWTALASFPLAPLVRYWIKTFDNGSYRRQSDHLHQVLCCLVVARDQVVNCYVFKFGLIEFLLHDYAGSPIHSYASTKVSFFSGFDFVSIS